MTVEISALVHKDCGPNVLEQMAEMDGVKSIFVETARSDDLFEDKQFGEFGEAAVITVIAQDESKDNIFNALYGACALHDTDQGLIFMAENVIKIVPE
tara:strand:- start:880 stop:1173 length:294 start_codon:yes stop_codon:yes gene_type:complete